MIYVVLSYFHGCYPTHQLILESFHPQPKFWYTENLSYMIKVYQLLILNGWHTFPVCQLQLCVGVFHFLP